MKKLVVLATLAGSALAAQAGLKYWDAGDYDADAYVQDGLLLHYDGIRNDGIDKPHNPDTTWWQNIAPGYEYWPMQLASYAANASGKYNWTRGQANSGYWTDKGYWLDGYTYFAKWSDTTPPTTPMSNTFTIQIAVEDVVVSNNLGNTAYLFWPGTASWNNGGVGMRKANGGGTPDNSVYAIHKGGASRPYFAMTGKTPITYVTSILDVDKALFFSGTAKPTSGNGCKTLSSAATTYDNTWYAIGAHHGQSNVAAGNLESVKGLFCNFRYYSRVLTDDELRWNRIVDDARFRGILPAGIPATNAVLASSAAAVSGHQRNGSYAVDAAGYTFSAPASTNVNGRAYACTGYTLETWDAETGDWGTPQSHAGELSCAVAETSPLVRITWQWTKGDGLVTYEVDDYVQDGLVLHYDGIRNVGAALPHSTNTLTWVNLASPGRHDLKHYNMTRPAWTADGCTFPASASFIGGALTVPAIYTTQALVDAATREMSASLGYIWFADGSGNWSKWSCSVRQGDAIWFNTHDFTVDRPKWGSVPYIDYFTGVANGSYAAAFAGTEEPTNAPGRYACSEGKSFQPVSLPKWSIGGDGSNGQKLVGAVKNFRLYDRVLSKAELEHNRRVDNARFYGILPVTNVVVASTHLFLPGNEASGRYQVQGAYTFTAPEAASDRGVDYVLDGYTIETWTDGEWGPAAKHEGASYAYATTAGKVRLTWQWKATRGLRTAADYDVQDYAGAGLFLNYDGIRNVGFDASHKTNAAKWVNLAPAGAAYDLAMPGGTKMWMDDGFPFLADRRFYAHNGFVASTHYTFQTLVDAKTSDHGQLAYVFFPPARGDDNTFWQKCSIGIRKTGNGSSILDNSFYLVSDIPLGGRPCIVGDQMTYATAMMCGDHSVMFAGTEAPTSGTIATGYKSKSSGRTPTPYDLTPFLMGMDFRGTIKNLRYYDRVLTTAELARNRNVDSARYFGALATTNVFVEAGGGAQAETGAYKVEGAWTFTATTKAKKNGTLVPVARYTVETLANGAWTGKTWHEGASYTYTEGTDPAAVRLTWHGHPDGAVIVVR